MTEKDILRFLVRSRLHRTICMPHFTPLGWWECDLLEITKAGYWREYEVKVSREDFRADAKKEKVRRRQVQNKHALLAARDIRCPNQFFFVCPHGLLAPEEVPEWAGLIHMPLQTIAKPAPRLRKDKVDESLMKNVLTASYFRYMAKFWAEAVEKPKYQPSE